MRVQLWNAASVFIVSSVVGMLSLGATSHEAPTYYGSGLSNLSRGLEIMEIILIKHSVYIYIIESPLES